MPASLCSGARAGGDHLGVPDRLTGGGVDQGAPGDGDRRRVQQVGDLAEHGQRPAGPEQVLHQVPAGRLQVDQQRHLGPDPVEVLQGEVDAQASGDGEQVHHGVGRPADGREGDDRVVERRPGDDLR